jgi:hypothetical protein
MSMIELDQEEDLLRSQVTQLSPEHRQYYYRLEGQGIKDPDTYAALNYIIVGGLHHFYLGRWLFGLLNLTGTIVGGLTFSVGGWMLVAVVLVIELPQLFRSQAIIKRYNNQIMAKCLTSTRQHFHLSSR